MQHRRAMKKKKIPKYIKTSVWHNHDGIKFFVLSQGYSKDDPIFDYCFCKLGEISFFLTRYIFYFFFLFDQEEKKKTSVNVEENA